MTNKFWAITTFFNPAKFKSLLYNYSLFAEQLQRQNVNLLTIECAFNDDEFEIPLGPNVHRLSGNSVMWQKERLINYGISKLPADCEYFGWLDCDVLFSEDNWAEAAVEKLNKVDIVQLYKRIYYLPRGHDKFVGEKLAMVQGIVWQQKVHKNWLDRRRRKELPFSAPGFAWAAKRSVFDDISIYDRNIIGSGDTFLVDCYFNSWDIHGYASKFTSAMKSDMMQWREAFDKKKAQIDYLPIDIYHLWHGSLKNRHYMDRHDIVLKYGYDPYTDIKLVNDVYEWASDKTGMHESINQYFYNRKEDET